jgi:hypothetical protein
MRKDFYLVYFRRLRDISQSMFIFTVNYESAFRMVIESGLLLLDVYAVMELRSLLALSTRLNLAIYKIHGYKTSIPSNTNASFPHRLAAGQITT